MSVPMQDEIKTFEDIIRLLQERPALREQLRQLLLTQELLALPQQVAQLAEAVSRLERQVDRLAQAQERAEERLGRLEERVGGLEERVGHLEGRVDRLEEAVTRLAEAQARTEARLEELAAAQARTEARVESLANAQARTEQELRNLAATVAFLVGEVGDLRGWQLEEEVRRRPLRYLRRFIASPRVLDEEQVMALAEGLPESDIDSLLDADLVVEGKRDGGPVYAVIEVSRTARVYDVDRAADRADILRQAVKEPVLAAVIGNRARPAAVRRAGERQVWQIIGRQVWAPGERLPDDLVADGPDGDHAP